MTADEPPMADVLPLPDAALSDGEAEFWRAAAAGRFLLRRCDRCGAVPWFPRPFCPECGWRELTWFEASGEGTVYSFTIARKAGPPFDSAVPYVIASIDLAEGPRIISNVVGCPPERVHIGQHVTLRWTPRPNAPPLYRFAPT